ncbi:MAG: ATP-binding cassette domain-containing protein [Bdellovibrionota bacterium]
MVALWLSFSSEAKKFAIKSLTAKHLISNEQKKVKKSKVTSFDALTVVGANLNYLNIDRVSFVFRSLNVVTGVSGAGKSSLVLNTLYPNLKMQLGLKNKRSRNNWSHCERIEGFNDLTSIAVIDRRPIAKSSVSMPVTYLDVFTDIRRLYEKLPDSQLSGLSAKSFSLFSEGGRCEECKGKGEVILSMKFLSDARVRCPICFGGRYKEEVNLVKYNGLSISSVLDLTVDQALDHFRHHKRISKRLESVVALGLGYLKLGQTSASLSGGEAQRLKLAPFLSKNWEPGSVLVIDEPTQGLHFEDVERLVMVFKKMVDSGLTIIIIEHNPEVICAADWVIDLGPLSCAGGGKLVYQGPVEGLMKVKNSPTGKFLASRLA